MPKRSHSSQSSTASSKLHTIQRLRTARSVQQLARTSSTQLTKGTLPLPFPFGTGTRLRLPLPSKSATREPGKVENKGCELRNARLRFLRRWAGRPAFHAAETLSWTALEGDSGFALRRRAPVRRRFMVLTMSSIVCGQRLRFLGHRVALQSRPFDRRRRSIQRLVTNGHSTVRAGPSHPICLLASSLAR